MVKIQKISEIEPCLGFTEFDMLKKYRQSFATSELGRLHSLFPFSELNQTAGSSFELFSGHKAEPCMPKHDLPYKTSRIRTR